MNENGAMVNGKDSIVVAVEWFFSKFFHSNFPSIDVLEVATRYITSNIDTVMNERLTQKFTKEEVTRVMFEMGPYKSSSLNGFHAIFYYKFWHIVRPQVVDTCLGVLKEGTWIAPLNSLHVVLIPKKKNSQQVADLNPSAFAMCPIC